MDHDLNTWARQAVEGLPGRCAIDGWEALAVEASHRRFYRLRLRDGRTLVAMSSPPDLENNGQFVALAALLQANGIGVPELLVSDQARGLFLMTDLGERHFADVYAEHGPAPVMPGALETLRRLQQIDDARSPPYTRQRFEDELDIYVHWCLERWLGRTADASVRDALRLLVDATDRQPRCCVHRDFHARNLLLGDDGRVGVVDFQDALMGPATYDLASLLRDCYYTFPEAEVARWRNAYLDATPLDVDRAGFPRDFDFTALQRQLKAVGIFVRLHLRDGRDSHLVHVVPVLRRIHELAAGYPELRALTDHTAAVMPTAAKRMGAAP